MATATATARQNACADFATRGTHLGLLSALTLQATANAGATSISVDLSVAVGDTLVFDYGLGTVETKKVTAVSGTGPYTVTISALANQRLSGSYVSHIPIATVHELSGGGYARQAANWGSATDDGTTASIASAVAAAASIASGATVGAVAVFTASTAGTYLDADPILPQHYSSAGTGLPAFTKTFT